MSSANRKRDAFRKYESGASKRKRIEKDKILLQRQKDSLLKYLELQPGVESEADTSTSFTAVTSTASCSGYCYHSNDVVGNTKNSIDPHPENISDDEFSDAADHSDGEVANGNTDVTAGNVDTISNDPGNWPQIDDNYRIILVRKGPVQVTNFDFPTDDKNRRFTSNCYYATLANQTKIKRRWLIYSKRADSVFCFACKLFGKNEIKLTTCGYNDWKNIHRELVSHEASIEHKKCMRMWVELANGLAFDLTIDNQQQKLINDSKLRWVEVLKRLIAVIQYLAQHNIAFRGKSSTIFTPNNGNFLGLIETFAKFDHILQEHLRKIKDKVTHVHYLGWCSQNQFIDLIAKRILSEILSKLRRAKYYSIILDCTSDYSHEEQMTIIIRFVEIDGQIVEIKEHFLGFVGVVDTTGAGLTEKVLEILAQNEIKLEDMRGQSYDNGANMRGHRSGVQQKILELNRRAFFTPCGNHNLNLLINDAAKSSVTSKSFFGYLQQLYAFLSASTHRWEVFCKHCKKFTLKRPSDTRWESRVRCTQAIISQAKEIRDALVEIKDNATDGVILNEARSLINEISSYQFLICLVIWHTVLVEINRISKLMQSSNMQIGSAMELIKSVKQFLIHYRENGFEEAINQSTLIANGMDVDPVLNETRIRRQRRFFDYEGEDMPIDSAKDRLQIEFFNCLVDAAISSLNERFTQLHQVYETFGFLFNISALKNYSDDDIRKCCLDLYSALSDGDNHDIDGVEMFSELRTISNFDASELQTSVNALNFLYNKGYAELFPNTAIALQILMTIPVSVASGERSFSKLKLIKNYLRSQMSQERLNGLAMISIEREIAKVISYDDIISDFALLQARRIDI